MAKNTLKSIRLDDLISNRFQPRKAFVESDIQALARSIEEIGLLHPPVVHQIAGSHLFEIISGERRVRACRLLGLQEIDVIERKEMPDTLNAKAALIENVQRVDLDPIEVAKALRRLINEFDITQEEIAEKIGKKRSTVSNFLRLLQLPDEMQHAIGSGFISMAHAKVILSCASHLQKALFLQIVQKKLSVRQAERYIQTFEKPKKNKKNGDIHCKDLEKRLESYFGVKACVEAKKEKGKVTLFFHSFDDLDRIMELCSS
jgi:ParB family transcriptional regulator, chromosome partitioning protein